VIATNVKSVASQDLVVGGRSQNFRNFLVNPISGGVPPWLRQSVKSAILLAAANSELSILTVKYLVLLLFVFLAQRLVN